MAGYVEWFVNTIGEVLNFKTGKYIIKTGSVVVLNLK